MASVDRLNSGKWQARWRADGKQRKRSFPRKIDAGRFLTTVEANMLHGSYIDPSAGRVTIGDYAERRWLPSLVHLRPSTLDLYRSHLRTHVLPGLRVTAGRVAAPRGLQDVRCHARREVGTGNGRNRLRRAAFAHAGRAG